MEKEQLQQKYRELSKKLSKIGYICKGSVMSVYIKCGKPYCRCKTDKNTKHGPYMDSKGERQNSNKILI